MKCKIDKNFLKYIPGFEGFYSITTDGRVWSHRAEKYLKPLVEKKGYISQIFHVNGKKFRFKNHRMVLLTYLGSSELQVNHKNGIKSDNRLQNLEYCDQSYNIRHADRTGLRKSNKGVKNGKAKLNFDQINEIRISNVNPKELAKKYGVHWASIYKIKSGMLWKNL